MTAQVIWTLSTLPSAASALQSSISALERDITVRESQSSGLEPWLGWFTLLVAIGVALEILVVIHDHRKEVNEWRVSELMPEGPSLIKLGIQIASIILVIAGVMGEFGVGLKISSINGQLRSKGAELRSKSDQLLALVTQEAADAETSANNATDSARIVGDQATNLAGMVSQLSTKLDASEKAELEQREKVVTLEKELEWRHVSPEQANTICKGLSAFRGTRITVETILGDGEGSSYGQDFVDVLNSKACGWIAEGPNVVGRTGVLPEGIVIVVEDSNNPPPVANALWRVLESVNVAVKGEATPGNAMTLLIGIKPRPRMNRNK